MKKRHLALLLITSSILASCDSNLKSESWNNPKGAIEIIDNFNLTASSEEIGFEAPKASDGNFETYWLSSKSEDATLTLDLGKIMALDNVTQIFKEDDIWYFDIVASTDGENYFTLLDNTCGVYGKVFSEGLGGYARYIELRIHKSEKNYRANSIEFFVDAHALSEGTNVALGLKGDASSSSAGYEPIKVFDGDYGNYWCAVNADYPQWVSGEFSSLKYVKSIEISMHDNGSYSFELEVRNKIGEWKKVSSMSTKTGQQFTFDINEEIDALVYRVSSGPGWANIAEIRVNGFDNLYKSNEGILDFGSQCYIYKTDSNAVIYGSNDGYSFELIERKSNIDKTYRYIKGLSENDVLYGYSLSSLLNFNLSAEVKDYTMESHHISNATLSLNNIDFGKKYYESETRGKDVYIKFDLGREVLINKIDYEFITQSCEKFGIYGSKDDITYDLITEQKPTEDQTIFSFEVNNLKYRFIKFGASLKNGESLTSKHFHIYGNGNPKREKWWQDTSGVIRFYPKEQQITLKEITARLDEYRYSGYRVIELHQPYEGMADIWAGLGGTNNYQIDPIIGSLDDLRTLLTQAHEKGFKVFMFGNVGYGKDTSDVFIKACRDYALGIESRESQFFVFSENCPDSSKWFWSDIANAYYYGYWGENGQIPTYNFANEEWQQETYNYIKFWSDFGVDGIALDAPDVYYYGGVNSAEVTFNTITKILRSKDLFSLPEGSPNTNFIHAYKYSGVQNYNITSWGGAASSLGINASRNHSAKNVDDSVKSVRDTAVALGGIAIGGMNFEDNYENCTSTERVLESALVTTTGHMAFLHLGSSAKIGQDIMKTWDPVTQKLVARSFALQNSLSSLNASGERTILFTNNDAKYYSFLRTNLGGKDKSIVIFNYDNSDKEVTINLNNTTFDATKPLTLYDAYNDETIKITPTAGYVKINMKANSHRVLIVR